ncbi:phloretin 4'-O-glucosyltransferase-like [Benincasa hispida]|uniref:phloretin 4'-O-glucosyltransferase-like n=1 Tax=Benincasa hispida TaxID=102211 RepID=UPI00190206B0|nr:phloretin 4'-O-glucosyltransferase-like [Benincasa hispida]
MELDDNTTGAKRCRVLLVTFCVQGHINPSLQFAKRLTRHRLHVTFFTSLSVYRRMSQIPSLPNLSFASFSDGYDDGFKPGNDPKHFFSEMERLGSDAMKEMITTNAEQGQPFTCVVYSLILPWAAAVARSLHLPSYPLWIQPATVFALYYYYFNGYQQTFHTIFNDTSKTIQLPELPLFTGHDVPSFFHSSDIYQFALPILQKLFELLLLNDYHQIPTILVNTFDELEHDVLQAMNKFFPLLPIGPLIPSAFLDGRDPSDVSFGGDLFPSSKKNEDYIDWLNSKPQASVVYVSFGSISTLSKLQNEEVARGLLSLKRPFLWVVRAVDGDENTLNYSEELEREGKIISWSSQLEVLSSPATGCFLTHCGWNSTLESLVCGVPMVVFPQWSDQATNAKIIRDFSETGVRLEADDDDDDGSVVKGEEIKRCLELVMGDSEKGKEIRKNAVKWKKLAKEAASEGGSSHSNFKAFVDQICS